MNVVLNGTVEETFTKIPLTPVIYSHAKASSRNLYSGTCKDLASHGFIVFSIDHKDGTCIADKVYDSKPMHSNLSYR